MAKKSLRAQLNQIRAWVRQGRTDAWIAHQLEVPASELREFRRRHELTADGDDDAELDLRDEIEAEIEAATLSDDEEDEEEEERRGGRRRADEAADDGDEDDELTRRRPTRTPEPRAPMGRRSAGAGAAVVAVAAGRRS